MVFSRKILFYIVFLDALHLFAQKDSTTQLASIAITTTNLNRFTVGQVQLETDSQALKFLQQQPLQDWLMMATPLSFRTYGTGAGSVSARGTGANHTALLWNGINIQNTLNGIVDLPTIEVGSSKIALKMGASTALFGSGAMGASILIDDEKPQEVGLKTSLNIGVGSFGYQQLSTNFKYKKGGFAGDTRLSSQGAMNDFSYKNTSRIGQPLEKAINGDFKRFNITQHFFFDLAENHFLKIHFCHSQNKRSVMPSMTTSNDNAVLRDTATRAMLEWNGFFGNAVIKARTAWLDDNNNYYSDKIKNSQNRIQRLVNEVEINKNISQNYTFRLSGNYTKETSLNNNYDQNHTRNRIAILCNQTFQKEQIGQFSLNLRQEITDRKATPFTFSLGVLRPFFLAQAKKLYLRSSFSRVYNLPSFNDLYWKNLGNPDLLPEQGWSSEIGLTAKGFKNQQKWKADITFFHIDLKNQLVWLPINGISLPKNLNEMRSTGIEFMSNYALQHKDWLFTLTAQYQLANARDKEGSRQIFVPLHTTNSSLSVKYKNTILLWNQTFSGGRYMGTENSDWLKGYTIGNCNIVFSPRIKKINIAFAFRILNVFNTDYQILAEYPNPKRNFKTDITLNF